MQSASAINRDVQPAFNNDLGGLNLSSLKKGAREKSPQAIREVAKQFESLFVQMMLKSMRDTVPEDALFGSKAGKTYQQMYDKQLSMHISEGRGIGLASTIERQLGGTPENELRDKKAGDYLSNPRPIARPLAEPIAQVSAAELNSNVSLFQLRKNLVPEVQKSSVEAQGAEGVWSTAKDFIKDVLPYAQRAAKVLGVDAEVLVAQSALETGWGKFTPKHADGSNSFNLFGIKADTRWQGETLEITTREFRYGVMQQEQADFRSYDSPSAAFEDYTNFILQNPRYQKALERGYDSEAYARELQKAGYATDPDYAKKINRIRNSEAMQRYMKSLSPVG